LGKSISRFLENCGDNPLLDRKEFGVLPHVFELAFCETYNIDLLVIDRILLEQPLQDRLYESNRGQMLLLAAGKSRFEAAMVVAHKNSGVSDKKSARFNPPLHSIDACSIFAIALHVAVERSQSDIMAGLVAAGVQIDARDNYGDTALHYATHREDATMMDFSWTYGTQLMSKTTTKRHHRVGALHGMQLYFTGTKELWKLCSIMGPTLIRRG
jgi:hypothetical protein